MQQSGSITDAIGDFPYRIQMAGGWIDQPFVSQLNPETARVDGGGQLAADIFYDGPRGHGHRLAHDCAQDVEWQVA